MTDLRLKGGVTAPGGGPDTKPIELKFDQRAGGVYEAEFKAEEAGSYFINAQAIKSVTVMKDGQPVVMDQADSVRSGVTVPYSPEFADLESNAALLRRLAVATGGQVYEEDDAELARVARAGSVFRRAQATKSHQPIWFWLLLAAALTFLTDVAVRRIALEPAEMSAWAGRTWDKFRGRVAEKAGEQFLDRLQSKKVAVISTLEQAKPSRRFEVRDDVIATPPPPPRVDAGAPPPVTRGADAAPLAADDAFARLMQAKRKALEERDRTDEPS